MKESTLLSIRDVVDRYGEALRDVVLPGLRDVTVNERITRTRTDKAEDRLDALELFTLMGLWDRLRWIVTGRAPESPRETQDERQSETGCGLAPEAEAMN